MSRPLSDERRQAILRSATRVIASEGLGASTAAIAQDAGISNGSLFTYFATKSELFNALFVALKLEMGARATDGLVPDGDARDEVRRMWNQWLDWAITRPDNRRALAQLTVSDEITPASHSAVGAGMASLAAILERTRAAGPMRSASLTFVLDLMSAVAETTIDTIIASAADAGRNRELGFEAMWRILA
jgi:AcrR family transcriptional regulator